MTITMMTLRRTALLAAGVLAAAAPSTALAATDGTASPTVSATLSGGTLSVTPPTAALAFGTHGLTGSDETLPIDLDAWTVNDATGDGLGWSLKAKVSNLTDTTDGAKVLTNAVVQLKALGDATSTDLAATEGPAEAAGTGGYIDAPADDATTVSLASAAANKGMGLWTFPAQTGGMQLRVPADAKAGDYAGTLTLTLSQTP